MRFPSLRNALFHTCLFQYLRFQRPRFVVRDIAERHNVDVVCLQETHVDADFASRFSISGLVTFSAMMVTRY